MRLHKALPILVCTALISEAIGQATSTLIKIGSNGRLQYAADPKGNTVPDYSWVGYRNGTEEIPAVPVVKEINPVTGDNRSHIQAAIDEVSRRTPDDRGIRGAVLLRKGVYRLGDAIQIRASGVILRGEGYGDNGTHLIATARKQHDLVIVTGNGDPAIQGTTSKKLTAVYVPTGARSIDVETGHGFKAGDRVVLRRAPNSAWLSLIGMNELSECGGTNWTTGGYTLDYRRNVMSVSGNSILLDAPVVDPIDEKFSTGTLMKYTWNGRVENVGIEALRLVSEYQSTTDENHGRYGVSFDNAEHGWVRGIEARHFVQGAVSILENAQNISVIDSRSIDPMSKTEGGRKYSFNVDGQRNLFKGCYTRNGRHDYVAGPRVPGPNVFLRSQAEDQHGDIGPHQRWATGILFDNIKAEGEITVRNTVCRGSGHGWTGAQNMIWNSTAGEIIVQSPPGHVNWAIGNMGKVSNVNDNTYTGPAVIESTGKPVQPASLYEAQLADRKRTTSTSIRGSQATNRPWSLESSTSGIRIHADQSASVTLRITSITGRLLGERSLQVSEGWNTIPIERTSQSRLSLLSISGDDGALLAATRMLY